MTMMLDATTATSTTMAAWKFLTLLLWLSSHAFAYLHPLSPQSLSSSSFSSSSPSLRMPCSSADWGQHRHRHRHHDHNCHGRGVATTTAIHQSSQSANDNLGGFHYDTVPRGTSYISQVSKHDLSERRRMKRSTPRRSSFTTTNPATSRTTDISSNDNNEKYNIGDSYTDTREKVEEEADNFQREVFSNLQSMTVMLQEMRKSQCYQEEDIRSLSNKVADMAVRLGQQQILQQQQMPRTKKRVNTKQVEEKENGNINRRNKSYGKSLDGEFHQRIKNVIDGLDEYHNDDDDDNNYTSLNYMYGANKKWRTRGRINNDVDDYDDDDDADSYTKSKVVQLESRIRKMDKLLRSMEGNVNAQMEYVDEMVNQRLNDIEDDVATSSPLPPPPPPRDQVFVEEHFLPHPPLPPPSSASYVQQRPPPLYPPPPLPSHELYDNPCNYNEMDDDGRTYYQERNFNDPNYLAPPSQQIPQQTRKSNSANERSRGYHYNERNTSFISAFSKADNERRRQFQPFRQRGGQNEENANTRWNNNRVEPSGERLTRGVRYPPNREFGSFSRLNVPPPPMLGQTMMMQDEYFEDGSGGYFDAPYLYDDDRPMMLEGEGYLYDEDNIF